MKTVSRLYRTFEPSHYKLSLTLDRTGRTFQGSVVIEGQKTESYSPLVLHAKDLTIAAVSVNEDVDVEHSIHDNDELVIGSDFERGDYTVSIDFSGEITDPMHGLYPCYFEHDNKPKELLATQFESHHAREVFPCIDEPEAKATFDLELITETGVTVLGNMPVLSQSTEKYLLRTTFETSPRMSTYLLAFVVGELQKKTASTKSGVEVNVWATPAQPAASLTFPLKVAVDTIDFFDEYFDTPYPLPKADHVALPDFSSGAMENWGLITYREVAMLVDANSSVSIRERVATVIAHETSHQWFGNLVTMKWWDDLWLNESFATIMEYVAVDALFPQWQAWNTFASQETLSALRRDQLAGVQAVKCEVKHPDEIITLFDPSIVYAKGGRLLKMLRAYIGEDAFRSGLQDYFKKHAYQNTVGSDLWRAFSRSSGKDVEHFMETWIAQPGFPIVSVTSTPEGYELAQERFVVGAQDTTSLWPIPLFAHADTFPELLDTNRLELSGVSSPLPLLNRGNEAHFIAEYDEKSRASIEEALGAGELDVVDRLALLHETSLLTRAGKVPTSSMIPLLKSYRHETTEPVWDIMSMVIADLKRFVETDPTSETNLKLLISKLSLPLFQTLGFEPRADETEQDTKLRATIIGLLSYADNDEVITQGLKAFHGTVDLAELSSELRGIILSLVAKHGTQDDFDRLLTIHDSTPSAELRDDIAAGLCATREEAQITRLLSRLDDASSVKQQDVFRWFIYLLRSRFARDQTWQWMTSHWDWIESTFGGDKSYDDFPRYSASVLDTKKWLTAYDDFFRPMTTQTALKRAITIGHTEISSRMEWLERDQESVRATLAQETE